MRGRFEKFLKISDVLFAFLISKCLGDKTSLINLPLVKKYNEHVSSTQQALIRVIILGIKFDENLLSNAKTAAMRNYSNDKSVNQEVTKSHFDIKDTFEAVR